jgi:hypothetical protein
MGEASLAWAMAASELLPRHFIVSSSYPSQLLTVDLGQMMAEMPR